MIAEVKHSNDRTSDEGAQSGEAESKQFAPIRPRATICPCINRSPSGGCQPFRLSSRDPRHLTLVVITAMMYITIYPGHEARNMNIGIAKIRNNMADALNRVAYQGERI